MWVHLDFVAPRRRNSGDLFLVIRRFGVLAGVSPVCPSAVQLRFGRPSCLLHSPLYRSCPAHVLADCSAREQADYSACERASRFVLLVRSEGDNICSPEKLTDPLPSSSKFQGAKRLLLCFSICPMMADPLPSSSKFQALQRQYYIDSVHEER